MVRLSAFALYAALLVSAPEPSFAEAAPALNPHLPRQTMKPRFAHNNPKHIKRREFQNTTISSAPAQPKTTQVQVPTTQAPATHDESTANGILNINGPSTPIIDGLTVVAGPVSIAIPGLGDGSSSSAPVSSKPQTSSLQSQARSASADPDPLGGLTSLLNSVSNVVDPNAGKSSSSAANPPSSNSANPPSSSASAASPSTQAAATPSSPGTQTAAQASPSSASNPANPLSGIVGPLTSAVGGVTSAVGAATSAIGGAQSALSTAAAPAQSFVSSIESAVGSAVSAVNSGISAAESSVAAAVTTIAQQQSSIAAAVSSEFSQLTSALGSQLSTAVAPLTSLLPTDTPTVQISVPSPTFSQTPLITLPTDSQTPLITLPSPTDSQTPLITLPITLSTPTDSQLISIPTGTPSVQITLPITTPTDIPTTVSNSLPPVTDTPSQSQPTGPVTQTVVPIPATSSPTDSQATSSAPSASASAPSQSASASPETQTAAASSAAPSSAASSPSAVTQPQTQSASAEPATTAQPSPSVTAAPTAPASTSPQTQVSIAATGSDTQTQIYVPTSLVIDTATQTPYTPPASTAAFSSNGIPSTMPHIIPPPGSGSIPGKPDGTTLIQIGFQYELNYPFVLGHSSAIYQIFEILPWGLAFGLDIDHSNITMQSLQPYDTSREQGFITTVALAYIPQSSVSNLTIAVPNAGSMLYKNPNATRAALMSVINPSFPVLAGAGMNTGDGTGSSNPASTSVIADQNPLDVNNQGASGVNGTAVGIGVGVCAGAAVYGAAMFFIAKRYKQRKARHSRSSSMIDTASMVNSTHEQQTGAGTALMSNAPDGSYGTRGGSRNSGGSAGSSRGRGEISAPVMAENSLGWN